jgi:hypothetical protein
VVDTNPGLPGGAETGPADPSSAGSSAMAQPPSAAVPPAPRDVAVTLPPLGNDVTRTVVRRWLVRSWTDGFVTGAPPGPLATPKSANAVRLDRPR